MYLLFLLYVCMNFSNFLFLRIFKCFKVILDAASIIMNANDNTVKNNLHVFKTSWAKELWDPFLSSSSFKNSIWKLLEYFGIISPLAGGDEFFIYSLIPEAHKISYTIPPKWKDNDPFSKEVVYYVARCYTLKSMNTFGFNSLLTHFYLITNDQNKSKKSTNKIIISVVYQNIICFEFHNENHEMIGLCRMIYDYERQLISLFVCEDDNCKTFFCVIAEELDSFLSHHSYFQQVKGPVMVCIYI